MDDAPFFERALLPSERSFLDGYRRRFKGYPCSLQNNPEKKAISMRAYDPGLLTDRQELPSGPFVLAIDDVCCCIVNVV